jgi:hypothetical protein
VFALVLAAGQADVPNHTYNPTTRNERVVTGLPDAVQLAYKLFVIRDIPHLTWVLAIILQPPVRRRSNYKMNAIRGQEIDMPRVAIVEVVRSRNLRQPGLNCSYRLGILRDTRQVRLVVGDSPDLRGQPVGWVKNLRLGRFGGFPSSRRDRHIHNITSCRVSSSLPITNFASLRCTRKEKP